MAPQFFENDDDSHDYVKLRSPSKTPKKPATLRGALLEPQDGNATVTEIFPNQCAARLDGKNQSSLCSYKMSSLVSAEGLRERSPVCVGDRVRLQNGVITGRCQRRNQLIRSSQNDRDPVLHVLAANIDFLVIVAAAREPDFSVNIVDRFLVAASSQKIQSLLAINKTDLLVSEGDRPWSLYASAGIAVVETSAHNGHGADQIMNLLRGKTTAFCGHSGVGKTSLLRRLLNDENYGRIGAISQGSGKGRHTTSGALMLAGPNNSIFIDTPGIMNFGLVDMAPQELITHFPELYAAAQNCGLDCAHHQEPACALRAMARYDSYRTILSTLTA